MHCAGAAACVTESLSQLSLSDSGVLPSLSHLITVGYQLQRNLTHLLVSTTSLSFPVSKNVVNVPKAPERFKKCYSSVAHKAPSGVGYGQGCPHPCPLTIGVSGAS